MVKIVQVSADRRLIQMCAKGKTSATYTATGLLLASLFGVAPAALANDWASLGLDVTRGRASDEKSGAAFSPAWNTSPAGAPYVASPLAVDGFVVVASTKGDVSALSVANGRAEWTVKAGGSVGASPTYVGGRVFVSTLAGQMQALRLSTGAQLWKRAFGGQNYASPLFVSDAKGASLVLGAGFPQQKVVRLSATTGDTQWETAPDAVAGLVSSSAALGAGRVVFGMNGGRYQSVDLATGETAWKADAKGFVGMSAPLVVGRTAYFLPGGGATALYAADVATGALVSGWPIEVLDPAAPPATTVANRRNVVSSPALLGDLVVFVSRFEYDLKAKPDGTRGGHVLREILAAVSPAQREVVWQQEIGRRDVESINDVPELAVSPTPLSFATESNPLVAVASSIVPQVRVLDIGGKQVWSASTSAPTRSSPVLANGLLVVATDAGVVHAFASDVNRAPAIPTAGFDPEEGQMVDGPAPVLKWAAAADAEGQAVRYQVRVLAEGGDLFESPLAELTTAAGEPQVVLERGLLTPGLAYRYAVRSRDANGAWAPWSQPRSFMVAVKPPITVDGKPVDSIDDAIAALPAAGGTINLGRGVLHLREALQVPAGVSLVGAGAQDTIIDANGLSVAVKMAAGNRTGAPALKNVTVTGADVGVQVIDVQGAVLRNVVVRDNEKAGVQIEEGATADAINVTLTRNGAGAVVAGKLGIRSSIVASNETGLSRTGVGTLTSRYNDVFGNKAKDYDGAAAGTGDISAAVTFRSTADFHVATRQASTDQGDPTDEYAHEPLPNGARVNMGAFGNTPSAELSLTQNGWKAVAGAGSSSPSTPSTPAGGGSACAIGGTPAAPSWLMLALSAVFLKRRRKG
jgi:outer membrane protein assembly factor BamB